MIVMKFGGTSVGSAAAIERVVSIVQARHCGHPIVIVSAMGDTTDQLIEIGRNAARGQRERALRNLCALREFHRREGRAVSLPADHPEMDRVIDEHFQALTEIAKGLAVLGELTPRSLDAIASFGERLSSRIVALAFRKCGLESVHVDARQLILTDRKFTHATPLYPETYSRVAAALPPLAKDNVVVMGGFIAANKDGETTTLGRGGSDFTAALVGAGVDAEEIQIWTDVDGVMTCDPALVPDAHRVKTISFAEAAELAYFGARVLHPATVIPAMEKNIPVVVLNSLRPNLPGTRIVAQAVPCKNALKCVAFKRGITAVSIYSTRMLMAHGFLRRIFEVFDRHTTPVDMLATSEVSVSLTVDSPERLPEICDELRPFSEVTVENSQAIICVVGDNIRNTPGVAARVFGSIEGVNVRMISQGASLLNLGFVVADADLPRAVKALHHEFFAQPDPAVFD
ncbi:MAG TPA: lysine-sensitive aspartokinase 3 [Candidatus Acidoferrales bacterium]|nr:lysine-sensitive aspartokinase 3 [Candidatus Acidoferrales bacterium]